jgi:hypothetical protein
MKTIAAAILMAMLFASTAALAPLAIAGASAQTTQAPTQAGPARQQQQTPMPPPPPDKGKITAYNSCEECNARCSYGACFMLSSGACICTVCMHCGPGAK